uniref:hypothetical protein n=1 Tax=Agathobacter sp. TaxID=2021311 RepID=UPI004056A6E5
MKKTIFLLLLLLICGMVSADVLTAISDFENIMLQVEDYMAYAYAGITFKEMFWKLLYERGKMLVVLGLISIFPFREKLLPFFACFFTYAYGFFFMSCLLQVGVVGIPITLSAVFPHGILYGIVIMLMFKRKELRSYQMKKRVGYEAGGIALFLLLFITGCIIECYVGTAFMSWVIRLSLV